MPQVPSNRSSRERRVVVLREGPRRVRGQGLDNALGVLGASLLVLSVLLVGILPEQAVVDPQFRVEYESYLSQEQPSVRSTDLLPAGVLQSGRQNAVLIPVEVMHNNVYELVVQLYLEEDREETLPDVFLVELVDASGVVVQKSNPQPTLPTCDYRSENPNSTYSAGQYYVTCADQVGRETRIAFNLGDIPATRIVTLTHSENASLEQATQAIQRADTKPTAGTWHLRVWLEEVGQCPESEATDLPGQSQTQRERVFLCRLAVEHANGAPGGVDDLGNPFVINTEYRYYAITVA